MQKQAQTNLEKVIKETSQEPVTFKRIPKSKLQESMKRIAVDHKQTIDELADR